MDTKIRGDIAEQAVILQAMQQGWAVLKPLGDRLPYDLVLDLNGVLVKVQVKCAWLSKMKQNYVVDNRRTQTNRRIMKRSLYQAKDFDFAVAYIPQEHVFYIFPVGIFLSFGSEIHMVELAKRQRKPRSATYRDAWNLIEQWAARSENCVRDPVKFGEASSSGNPEPSLSTQV